MMLSDVCLSVAYIGHKSRTERPRKTKIGIEIAHVHVTRKPLSTSKGHQAALAYKIHTTSVELSTANLYPNIVNLKHFDSITLIYFFITPVRKNTSRSPKGH